MQQATFKQLKFYILSICVVTLVIYCFIAFLPIPKGIEIGLDPSWRYAISRAAAEKLIFGKDIIFTYGPLGYLIEGAAFEQNLFQIVGFRFTVYVTLFLSTFIHLLKLKTALQKIFLLLSLFFAFWLGISVDYQILFIFIIILSAYDNWSRKSIRWWALGLGAFAGFCLLTKFPLGICTIGSLTLLFVLLFIAKSSSYLKSNDHKSIIPFALAIIDSLVASVSVSFILLDPNQYLSNFKKVLVYIASASIVGVATWFIQQKISHKFRSNSGERKILSGKSSIQLVSWCAFYVSYCFCLFKTIFSSSPYLIDFLKNSLEIASGYSSAMSIEGNLMILILGVSEFVMISIFLIFIAIEGHLGLSSALFLVLFLAFKHGFVREDRYHVVAFAWCVPLIVSLCISKLRATHIKKVSYLLYTYILITTFMLRLSLGGGITHASLAPGRVISNLSLLFNPTVLQSRLNASNANNLARVKLPEKVTNLVKDKKIDIIPWEISLAEANKLNWKPRPIFQSYSAYTTSLDNLNFESLSQEPRDYIFYSLYAIDGRHPFFDEPKTFFYVFCNYKLSSDSLNDLIILEKRKSSICSPIPSSPPSSSIYWNSLQLLETQRGLINLAKIKFTYSGLGKIYKTLFRIPPVIMEVTYSSGLKNSYRIIPENSDNGVIVSHLPQNDIEAKSFFQGELPAQVRSFSFSTSNSLLYTSNIELNFLLFKINSSEKVD